MIRFQGKIWAAVIIAIVLTVSGMRVLAQEEPVGDPKRVGGFTRPGTLKLVSWFHSGTIPFGERQRKSKRPPGGV